MLKRLRRKTVSGPRESSFLREHGRDNQNTEHAASTDIPEATERKAMVLWAAQR